MGEPMFVKCEPDWPSDAEECPDLEPNLQLPCDDVEEVKVEPDHTFYRSIIEEENSELDEKTVVEEVSSEDDDASATLPNNFVDEEAATSWEIPHGQECNETGSEGIPPCNTQTPLGQQKNTWTCHICSGSFESESALKVHTCDCSQTSPSYFSGDDVMTSNTISSEKCGKELADHVCLIETTTSKKIDAPTTCDEEVYYCQVCGKKFSCCSSLSRHKLSHTGNRPHSCNLCGRLFALKSNMKAHMFTHTEEKPHSCSYCNRPFRTRPNLRRHMMTHTGQKPHCCNTCGKAFALRSNLKTHLLTHTGSKPFSCSLCGKVFAHRSNLKTHMFTHSDLRPHNCPTCGKSFTLKSHVNAHMLIHTERNLYSCNTCEKHFSKKSLLVQHVLTHLNSNIH